MAQTYKFGNGTWANKEGSTLAYSDTNNAFKPLPFSFSRDSIGTRVNKEGLIEVVGNDIPRIDYTDSTEGALLLENSATNLITYSEDFSNAAWVKVGTSVTSGFVSPSGDLSSFKLIESASNERHTIHSNIPTNSSTDYTLSAFVKKSEKKYVSLSALHNNTNGVIAQFDLELGAIVFKGSIGGIYTYLDSSIIELANGWYKISLTLQNTGTVTSTSIALSNDILTSPSVYVNGSVYQGDGTSGIYIWGAMLEANSYLSSYIPTNGSTIQRAAETCSESGNSEVFNDSEGVLYADISALANDSRLREIALSDGSSSNRLELRYGAASNRIQLVARSGGVVQSSISNEGNNIILNNKVLVKYKSNDFALWVNGFEVGTDTSGNTPIGLSELAFDDGNGGNDFYGKTKEIGYYDTALTDEELEYMTSYRSLNELVTELNLNTL